jgi:hypothetical protein
MRTDYEVKRTRGEKETDGTITWSHAPGAQPRSSTATTGVIILCCFCIWISCGGNTRGSDETGIPDNKWQSRRGQSGRADLECGARNVAEAFRLPVEEVGGAPGADHGCVVRRRFSPFRPAPYVPGLVSVGMGLLLACLL